MDGVGGPAGRRDLLLPAVPRRGRPAGHGRHAAIHHPGRRRLVDPVLVRRARRLGAGRTATAPAPTRRTSSPASPPSGARFAVTVGDNGYPNGSQTNYGDLQQVGASTSAIFGTGGWPVAGSSMALFPAAGNHGLSGTTHTDITTWTQARAVSSSGGRYQNDSTAASTARARRTTPASGTRSTPGRPGSTCSTRPGVTRTRARPRRTRTTRRRISRRAHPSTRGWSTTCSRTRRS